MRPLLYLFFSLSFDYLLDVALVLVSSRCWHAAEEQPRQIVQLVRQLMMTLVILALVFILRAHAATSSQRTSSRTHRPGIQLGGALRPAIDSATTTTSARVTGTMLAESVVTCYFRLTISLSITVVLLV